MCGLSVSSTQVSRVAQILDEELEKWRDRELTAVPYPILDAHYEKVGTGGPVRPAAVLTAAGMDMDGRRSILGVSVSLSDAETHWREFIKSPGHRGFMLGPI